MKAATYKNNPITSEDVIKQLVGDGEGWDQSDTFDFVIYKSSKFNGADVNVCLEQGIVEVLNDEGQVTDTFFIKCELIPVDITPNP
jgi:hypothetical protein